LAVIAGGGIAGLVQGASVVTRGASSAGTGGLANPILATAELGGSLITSILSLIAPGLVVLTIGALLFLVGWRLLKKRTKAEAKA